MTEPEPETPPPRDEFDAILRALEAERLRPVPPKPPPGVRQQDRAAAFLERLAEEFGPLHDQNARKDGTK